MGLAARDLTKNQAAIAKAAVDPTCLTVTEAAKRVGVHRVSASRALQTASVQREIRRLEAEQRDTAKAILPRAFRNVSRAVERDETGEYSLGTVKVLGEYVERVGMEEVSPCKRREELMVARRLLLAFAAGVSVGPTTSCGSDVMARVSATLDKLDHELSLYESAVSS